MGREGPVERLEERGGWRSRKAEGRGRFASPASGKAGACGFMPGATAEVLAKLPGFVVLKLHFQKKEKFPKLNLIAQILSGHLIQVRNYSGVREREEVGKIASLKDRKHRIE